MNSIVAQPIRNSHANTEPVVVVAETAHVDECSGDNLRPGPLYRAVVYRCPSCSVLVVGEKFAVDVLSAEAGVWCPACRGRFAVAVAP